MNDSSGNSLQDRLTTVLAANADVAERFGKRALPKFPLPLTAREITECMFRYPDSYFSAALARVAILRGQCFYAMAPITTDDTPSADWLAYFKPDDRDDTRGRTLREALQALWVAVLEAACEKCERCRGG